MEQLLKGHLSDHHPCCLSRTRLHYCPKVNSPYPLELSGWSVERARRYHQNASFLFFVVTAARSAGVAEVWKCEEDAQGGGGAEEEKAEVVVAQYG